MSLWDSDKTNDNRLNPAPKARDVNTNRLAHGTTAFTLRQEDTDSTLGKLVVRDGRFYLEVDGNRFIDLSDGNLQVFDTDSTNNVVIGKKPDGRGGIAVSKQGTNVEDIY